MRKSHAPGSGAITPFRSELARLFDPGNWPFNMLDEDATSIADWRPAIDIDEHDGEYLVRADLPGMEPKDINITLEDGVLTLRGEREQEHKERRKGYHRLERMSGSFFRQLALPDVADSDGVRARFDKGVLEIKVPKSAKKQARKISIEG